LTLPNNNKSLQTSRPRLPTFLPKKQQHFNEGQATQGLSSPKINLKTW
jgi:hypothetical protein